MDRLEAMRVFVRVVERRSFAQAAQDLLISKSRVSEAVQQLERTLSSCLLTRTTRTVTPTAEGEDYYRRTLEILAALDDADAAVMGSVPAGSLRIDVHGTFARYFLLPALPEFLALNPGICLHISEGDRLVDLIGEGVDCAIRIGEPAESGLLARKLGMLAEGTFASPVYLERHGTPKALEDLVGHRAIGFVSSATRAVLPFQFQTQNGVRFVAVTTAVTVSSASTNAALATLGVGLIQVPRYRVARELGTGALVEVLAHWPPPATSVYLLYPKGRQLSARVRLLMDWAAAEISARLPRN